MTESNYTYKPWPRQAIDEKVRLKSITDKLTASEALFGFAAWLTSFDGSLLIDMLENNALIADWVDEFCKVNNLAEPRDHWADDFIMPTRRVF